MLTVLAQDGVGGLQVKHTHEDGEIYWVDAKPLPGALVINVGHLLQVKWACFEFNSKRSLYDPIQVIFELSIPRVLPIQFNPHQLGTLDVF